MTGRFHDTSSDNSVDLVPKKDFDNFLVDSNFEKLIKKFAIAFVDETDVEFF